MRGSMRTVGGKTEMWYVFDASKEVKLVYGLRSQYSKEEIRASIEDGTVMKYLQQVLV